MVGLNDLESLFQPRQFYENSSRVVLNYIHRYAHICTHIVNAIADILKYFSLAHFPSGSVFFTLIELFCPNLLN